MAQTTERRGHPVWRGILIVIILGILAAGSFAIYVVTGNFNMNADINAGGLEAWLGNTAQGAWVSSQAAKKSDPVAVNAETLTRGAQLYQGNCAMCHGGSYYRISRLHRDVYPGAPQFLTKPAMKDPDGQIFYVVKHGIRFTAMPAWTNNMSDTDIWTLVNLLKQIDNLPPQVEAAWHQMPMNPAAPSSSPTK